VTGTSRDVEGGEWNAVHTMEARTANCNEAPGQQKKPESTTRHSAQHKDVAGGAYGVFSRDGSYGSPTNAGLLDRCVSVTRGQCRIEHCFLSTAVRQRLDSMWSARPIGIVLRPLALPISAFPLRIRFWRRSVERRIRHTAHLYPRPRQ
jgi:hypothetical protein